MNYSDFTSFSKLHSDVRTNLCTIYSAIWEENDKTLAFTIRADRFLRNMVRAIVGTMTGIGSGKITLEEFEKIIQARDRCRAGQSAPAKGLFLVDIEYPEEIISGFVEMSGYIPSGVVLIMISLILIISEVKSLYESMLSFPDLETKVTFNPSVFMVQATAFELPPVPSIRTFFTLSRKNGVMESLIPVTSVLNP
ncbi:MAG: truA [Bacteroidetes bacterium]|nr:truA [Bacteroidota bacterium]